MREWVGWKVGGGGFGSEGLGREGSGGRFGREEGLGREGGLMRVVREGLGGSRGTGQIGRVYVWVEGVHEWACARVCAKSVWRRRFVGARERVPERLWREPVLPLIHVGRVWVCGLTRREKVAAIMGLASMAASIELSCSCWKAFASIAVGGDPSEGEG